MPSARSGGGPFAGVMRLNLLFRTHPQRTVKRNVGRNEIKQDILRLLKNNGHKAYRPKEIAKQLNYRDNKTYRVFRDVLSEMEDTHLIGRVDGGRYTFRPRPTRIEGVLRVNPQGFGFVEAPGLKEDLYIHESNMKTALDGDLVVVALAAPSRGDRRREGEVLEVLERRRTQVVGTFRAKGHYAFVAPDDQRLRHDIYVPREHFGGATDGDKVMVSIDRFDDPHASPEGRILGILGRADDPAVRVLSLALSMDVRAGFAEDAIREAEAIPETIPPEEAERRVDLRDKPIFTIDPEDAKDFDDAIHILELPNGHFEVGVHIADVSHYVRPGSAIDREAYQRGTSVYLVDRTLPMLPEKLSNGVCSLRPREDKLAFSVVMEVSPQGSVKHYEIGESIIHSKHRFTYEEAQALIEGKGPDHPFREHLARAARLGRVLTKKRMRAGSVDFDLPEIRVKLDAAGNPIAIVRKDRAESNRLIEEFMLLANRVVAQHVGARKNPRPFVYRIHERPDAEKIAQLAEYVRAFGYSLPLTGGNVTSKALNTLLEHVKDAPEAPVIEQAALRAMAKARYAVENVGHYGLGFTHYTHFTSPIRRYPDLMVHRLLKQYAASNSPADAGRLETACDHCSERERNAAEAERESVKLKQVEYIQQHLGSAFDGVISGVTKFGVFVELVDLLVEGMVHVREMDDDYYEYDERTYSLMGRYSGRTYRLGAPVRVVVAGANVETRQVDFVFES